MEGKCSESVLVVAGLGEVYTGKMCGELGIFEPDQLILVDNDPNKINHIPDGDYLRIIADTTVPFIDFNNGESPPQVTAIIANPYHLETIKAFVNSGISSFIVEKPLVGTKEELALLQNLINEHPYVRIFPLDFYTQKAYPLLALAGKFGPEDPRWQLIQMEDGSPIPLEYMGCLEQIMGSIKKISVQIVEGGDFGIPDLERRPWLINNPKIGGIISDLGTHALLPLLASGLITLDNYKILEVSRYNLDAVQKNFIKQIGTSPEIKATASLILDEKGKKIPLDIIVAKTFEGPFKDPHEWTKYYPCSNSTVGVRSEGVWSLVAEGTSGAKISFDLRTGGYLVLNYSGSEIKMKIRHGFNPYALAFSEASRYLNGEEIGYDPMESMLKAINCLNQLKA